MTEQQDWPPPRSARKVDLQVVAGFPLLVNPDLATKAGELAGQVSAQRIARCLVMVGDSRTTISRTLAIISSWRCFSHAATG